MTVAFVTYRRLELLRQTHAAFLAGCAYPALELLVCDDGSPAVIQAALRGMRFDRRCLAPRNCGLGANQNAAIRWASHDRILALQDDWLLVGPGDFLQKGVALLQERPDVDFVRFWRHDRLLQREHEVYRSPSGFCARVWHTDGNVPAEEGLSLYSDRPHLRRRSLHERVGRYDARLPRMQETERAFVRAFESVPGIGVATICGYEDTFSHIGIGVSFNPDQRRENLRRALAASPIAGPLWRLYVRLRYGRRARD